MSAESPHSSGPPARGRPVLSELSKQTTEEDLWDLDENDAPGATPDDAAEAAPAKPQPELPGLTEYDPTPEEPIVIEAKRVHTPPRKSAPSKETDRAKATDDFDSLDDPFDPAANDDGPEASGESTPAAERPAAAEPAAPSPAPESAARPRMNRREIAGIGIFSFALLFAAIWGLAGFFGHLHFSSDAANEISFPVKGQRTAVASAESFWREPVREGPERDAARSDVVMIPVIELTLEPGGDTGALRVLFRNSSGEPVGDTITRTFSAGKFDNTGSERTECASTSGFREIGEFNAHRAGQSEPWTVLVLEGPGQNAPASQFTTLFETPLSTLRR